MQQVHHAVVIIARYEVAALQLVVWRTKQAIMSQVQLIVHILQLRPDLDTPVLKQLSIQLRHPTLRLVLDHIPQVQILIQYQMELIIMFQQVAFDQ